MFACSQLAKQKGIMPKEPSREVQTTKDSELIKILKNPKNKIPANKHSPPYFYPSFLLGEFQY